MKDKFKIKKIKKYQQKMALQKKTEIFQKNRKNR